MGTKRSVDDDDINEKETSAREIKRNRHSSQDSSIESSLNLEDLGAGYNVDDKRVARALKSYEEQLLPFIRENYNVFAKSGFTKIKGYATNLKDKSVPKTESRE